MELVDKYYAVLLHGARVGTLYQRGDHTRFVFSERYLEDPARPVLGLRLEERLRKLYAAVLRVPPWFSNLLPEGPLRQWIADDRGVSADREMELLAKVGRDLPGAVQVIHATGHDSESGTTPEWPTEFVRQDRGSAARNAGIWRFSLAGVALKFSMLARGDRLTVPAVGDRGDWLVKFPDYQFAEVPRNEHATMLLAGAVGIEVPEIRLVHRDELDGLPTRMWPNAEQWAYAVKRFDRHPDDRRIAVHIEDFAQVRDVYPHQKYRGSFETVAALAYRGRDLLALREFTRRLAFSVLVGNGDAHLKNWSLIYPDRRVPTLSPAYDLVSTFLYREEDEGPEDLGLSFGGSRRFDKVGLGSFALLEKQLDQRFGHSGAALTDVVVDLADRLVAAWPQHREAMRDRGMAVDVLDTWIRTRAGALRRG
jgi:serine/threonine-protein kinase HipA